MKTRLIQAAKEAFMQAMDERRAGVERMEFDIMPDQSKEQVMASLRAAMGFFDDPQANG